MEPVPTATPSPAAPRASDKSIWKFWLRDTPMFDVILKGFGFTIVRITFCLTSGFFSLTKTSTSVTASSSFCPLTPLSDIRALITGIARKKTALTTNESTNATGNRKYFARKSSITASVILPCWLRWKLCELWRGCIHQEYQPPLRWGRRGRSR